MRQMRQPLLTVAIVSLVAGCSPGTGPTHPVQHQHPPDMAPAQMASLTSIDVAPPLAMVTNTDATAGAAAFTATGHFSDGSTMDITSSVTWSIDNPDLGAIASGAFKAAAKRGGTATVSAIVNSMVGTAKLSVLYQGFSVAGTGGSTAPANSNTFFNGGTETAGLKPALAYPPDGARVPSNLGLLEVQWTKPSSPADLYEVSFESATLDYKVYTNETQAGGSRYSLTTDEWTMISTANKGQPVKISVKATLTTAPGTVGTATAATLDIDAAVVDGAIYYWAPESPTVPKSNGRIMRHAFGDTSGPPTVFYAPTNADGSGRCVGCHALTRDGTKFAFTYDGGNQTSAEMTVASMMPLIGENVSQRWNFASYAPDGNRLAVEGGGNLRILDSSGGAANGMVLSMIPGINSHPDWSPDGTRIAFTATTTALGSDGDMHYPALGMDWEISHGAIQTVTDMGNNVWSAPTTIVPADASGMVNNYYPSFSPDGKWILFNRAPNGDYALSYNAPDAKLMVVAADGSAPPIELVAAETSGSKLVNSWPRWTPFVQQEPDGSTMLYLTFSSIRNYGIEIQSQQYAGNIGTGNQPQPQPQIWMVAFDPGKAKSGMDPSSVAFWLPYQDVTQHNHIAQWTTALVPPVQ
jgi:hypothetical protein